ncbi:MAG: 4'-phosphopantetheinyl transferase superfamily protein [Lachnospiraceae bacterium]|nr:4'-phosphopantetheinyl transferase superfamily protein [Lachnospiraceae bacterium]
MKIYTDNINDHTIEELIPMVHEDRVKAAMKYRFEADRKRSLLAHALLNSAVKEKYPDILLPVMPVADKFGKPHLYITADTSEPVHVIDSSYIPDIPASADIFEHNGKSYTEVYFSVSHSGDYAVCALDDHPVGIDVEVIGKESRNIAERFFARDELEYITDTGSFYHIWTLKESFMKVVGLGMRLPMDSFSVTDYDSVSGCCGFSFNGAGIRTSDDSLNEIMGNMKPFMKEGTDELTIRGKCSKFADGYSLAVAAKEPWDGSVVPGLLHSSLSHCI